MPDPLLISAAMATAAITAAVVVLLLGLPWRRPHATRVSIGQAVGTGCGLLLGCLILGAKPKWPPAEDQDRLLLILLPAAILVEVFAALPKVPCWLSWIFRLA